MEKNLGLIIHPEDFNDLLNMSVEEAGMVTQNVIKYFLGTDEPIPDDRFLNRVTRDMRGRVDRDRKKYTDKALAGSKGGKISAEIKQKSSKSQAEFKQSSSRNQAENKQKPSRVQADVKQTSSPIPIPILIPKDNNINSFVEEIVAFLNEKTGKHFQPKGETERLINGRLNEGYTIDDFKKVITIKCNEWKDDPKYSRYLQPSTLFAPSHFDEYLNQPEKTTPASVAKPNQFTEGVRAKEYNFDELEKRLIKN